MPGDASDASHIAELEADVRRLRRLLDQRDAPGELRHRSRSTLAILRTIIRKSAQTKRDLDIYVGHLEDRVQTLMRAQAAIDAHGLLDLQAFLADELLNYGAASSQHLQLSGAEVTLQPKAGQLMAIAIHELVVNAVEHGALGAGKGNIAVSVSVSSEPDRRLILDWKESKGEGVSEPSQTGFGTEMLTRMLSYDLKAVTALIYEPDGLHCTISFPFPAEVGDIAER